jgi:Clostripain family
MKRPTRICRLPLLLVLLAILAACTDVTRPKEAGRDVTPSPASGAPAPTAQPATPVAPTPGAAAPAGAVSPVQQVRSVEQTGTAQWTILVYMAADNNLEDSSLANLQQMADAASSSLVNVVVQVTRDPASEITDSIDNLPAFTTTKRLLVQHDRLVERSDLGKIDSSDPATLADFVAWGERTFPAQHYLLDLSDHGGAWQGCCEDDAFQGFMDLPAIQRALKQARSPLDIIGFDACLMASVEVGLALQPYASLLIGSEESEPDLGWNYTAFLNALAARPDLSSAALARTIADTYLAGLNENAPDEAAYATFSVIDLQQLGAVGKTTAAFVSTLSHYVNDGTQTNLPERLRRIGQVFLQAEVETPAFGTAGPGDLGYALDLAALARNAAVESGAPALQQAAADLQQSLSRALVYAVAGHGYDGAAPGGLSIAALAAGDTHEQDLTDYGRLDAAASAGWLALVREFDAAVASASDLDLQPTVANLQASSRRLAPGETITVRGQVRDDLLVTDVQLGVATMLNGQHVLLSQDSRAKRLGKQIDFSFSFDGRSWYMTDGQVTESVYTEDWRPGQRVVFGTYHQRPKDNGTEAYCVIDEATGRVLQTFDISSELGLLGAILPGDRSTFTPYVFDADDEVTEIPLKPLNLKAAKLNRSPLPAGAYEVVVDGTNISGNTVSDSIAVTLTVR